MLEEFLQRIPDGVANGGDSMICAQCQSQKMTNLKKKTPPEGRCQQLGCSKPKESAHQLREIENAAANLKRLLSFSQPRSVVRLIPPQSKMWAKLRSIGMPRRRKRSLPDLLFTLRRAARTPRR